MFSGQKFSLKDETAIAFMKAMEQGAKFVKLGEGCVVSTSSFESLVDDETLLVEKLKCNPILNDPAFRGWVLSPNANDGMILDRKYPKPKYSDEWEEANENKWYLNSVAEV